MTTIPKPGSISFEDRVARAVPFEWGYGSTPRTKKLRDALYWKCSVTHDIVNVAMGLANCEFREGVRMDLDRARLVTQAFKESEGQPMVLRYARMVEKGEVFWEEEILSDMDQFNEWVMTGLRRLEEGVNLERVEARFGKKVLDQLLEDASPYLEAGDLQIEKGRLRLTEKSIFRADGIASDLFQLP